MNQKVFKTLEYTKIRSILADKASSPGGKRLCQELTPFDSLSALQKALKETSDALSRLWHGGSLSFSGVHDITASIKRLEVYADKGTEEEHKFVTLEALGEEVE